MTRYTLINMHDDYAFDAADDLIAAGVAVALGSAYGAQRGDEFMWGPMFLLSNDEIDARGRELFGLDGEGMVAAFTGDRVTDLIAALRTVRINPDGLDRILDGVTDEAAREQIAQNWHDQQRTSITDLRDQASKIADAFERRAASTS